MDKKLLDHLLCPFCGGDIIIKRSLQQENAALLYGLLTCDGCNSLYPVVEGIPIMMPPDKRFGVFAISGIKSFYKKGISVVEICSALENDDIEKVKEAVVYFVPYPIYTLSKYADILGDLGKRAIRKIMRNSLFDRIRTRYTKEVFENDKTTMYEAMGVYYQDHELFNYFFYKFGQPRFLTTLGTASIFDSQKPLLDIACGQGHLLHFLTQKNTGRMSIGIDRNFFQLVLAKRYIAPEGQYICAEADEKLPFRKDTFAGIICSDAFHYFPHKISCIQNLKEIMQDNGTIILNRVGNQYVSPNEGMELTPDGYLNLFNPMSARMAGENSLLDSYLDKRKPDLSQPNDSARFKDQKWLTVVASDNKEVFRDYGPFDEWPHRVGDLALNPLYKKTGSDNNGKEHYKFSYPSDWYAFEDALWQTYAPEEVTIPKDLLNSLNGDHHSSSEDQWKSAIDKYIDEFVIMGFPEKYM
jgi:uncharacterized protein YbaR (Trm112 family)/ubiquinone/menaquinone biosynthesis C-methylase UbiE